METITINKNDSGQRIDKFLGKRFKTMPVSLIYKYLRTKRIKVNGKKAKESYVLAENDLMELYIPDEFTTAPKAGCEFKSVVPRLSIAYEDENILIADKKAGMIVHSDDGEDTETLINHIKAYLWKKGEYDPEKENSFSPALCNRIDRNTAGLVIAAKNAESLRIMNDIIRDRDVSKIYLAVCHGLFDKKSGELTSYLEKNASENKVYIKRTPSKDTKTAVLRYNVIDENRKNGLSLLEVELFTGRTHQIRVQMADFGHPLLGDGKYAVNKDDRKNGYSCQALCAYRITFKLGKNRESLQYLNGLTVTAAEPKFLSLFA